MSRILRFLFASSFCMATAWGQSSTNQPHIGYLYPSGGQQGCVIQITAGGQFLRGVTEVHVSGEGVRASVIQYIRPLSNLKKEQRQLLQKRLNEVRRMRLSELSENSRGASLPVQEVFRERSRQKPEASKQGDAATTETALPDHPLLYDLESKSLRELAHISNVLFFPRNKQQLNRQLAESVLIEVTIDPEAPPGNRELRLTTGTSLTNPMVFQVGQLPEVRELEPNDQAAHPTLPSLPAGIKLPQEGPLELPVLLNGQILPGDVDRFRFRAQQGQQLVIESHARSLIPYLADAVPGWFQATLALYDAGNREVAFADDYRFDPDPVLFYRIPEDGEYELEIRDSIYRGREDFVYRIAVGEQPFITHMFPLGGKEGVETVASIHGWNLPVARLALDTEPGGDGIRRTAYKKGEELSNSVPYAVDTLPECNETEANDNREDAQTIDLPKIINGHIARPGDVDVFRFTGNAGDRVAAEVYGRRLNSPLDSLLRLTDASGNVVEWNDDHVVKDGDLYKDIVGLITHHADSYLMAELPSSGTYYVHLTDSQRHGGEAYAYRLRISAPQPDFALRVTPSSIGVRAGAIVPVCVHALRKDGFEGEIDVVVKDRSTGFAINGGRIPAGRDCVRMTLTAPAEAPGPPVALELEGRAQIDGRIITHPIIPADDLMQAFLYRHLVPTEKLLVLVQKAAWRSPPIEVVRKGPVRIPAGGSAMVQIRAQRGRALGDMQLELRDPPQGVTLADVRVVPGGLALELKADRDAEQGGLADNLIIEAFRAVTPRQTSGKPAGQKRRTSMGFLPAIPITILQR